MTTPAYEYGNFLGRFKRAIERVGEEIAAGVRDGLAYRDHPPMTELEAREYISQKTYERRIRRERELGLAYVRELGRQARRDLGLGREVPR